MGKRSEARKCTQCGKIKARSKFPRRAHSTGILSWCKACMYAWQRQWLKKNVRRRKRYLATGRAKANRRYATDPVYRQAKLQAVTKYRRGLTTEERKARSRLGWLRREYGLTEGQYQRLVEVFDSRCGICDRTYTPGLHMVVDHDHVTGRTRGLLCRRCNNAIGSLGDSIAGLQKAIAYLKQAEKLALD